MRGRGRIVLHVGLSKLSEFKSDIQREELKYEGDLQ